VSAELDTLASDLQHAKRRINWLAARRMYLAGASFAQIARRFGVWPEVVSRRAARERWTDPPTLFLAQRLEELNHE
jgi:transposase-like protein